jgi:RecA-family ATPase
MIMDPIQAYLGADVDMNRANEIRPIFRRLSEIAERTGCAIVLIGHLNKSAGTQSNYRGLGSIDIAAAVRSILFVGSVEKDDNIRVVIQQKDSLAPKDNPVAFKLSGDRFEWIGEYEITINELMAGNTGKKKETKLETAVKMIRGKLAQRKIMYVTDLEDEGKKLGIGARTVRDARTSIDPELEYGWDGKKRTVKLAEVTLAES